MTVLRDFIHSFDFVRMKPDQGFLKSGVPTQMQADALMETGRQYAAHFFDHRNPAPQSLSLTLLLPANDYDIKWVDVLSGKPIMREHVNSSGSVAITSPVFHREIALSIRR